MDNNEYPLITKPEDYQLIYHSNTDGHIWVDAKGKPIPLTQQLTGHIDTVDQPICGILGSLNRVSMQFLLPLVRETLLTVLQ